MSARPGRWPPPAPFGSLLGWALVATVLSAAVLAGPSPAGAVIDDPDLDTSADYRYRVEPEAGQVEVTIDLSVTADKANRTTATGYFQYFFDGTFLAIPAEVGDLRVTDGAGRALDYDIDDTVPDVIQLFIDFRQNLFYRQTTDVIISFTLPGGAARGDELTRVNGAYAGFQAWVDPRLEEATLAVITPVGFVDRSTGSEAFASADRRAGQDGDELWFVADDIDPEFQWASVSLARDGSLITTDFDVDDAEFDVLSWPGDQVWTEFVTDNLETGLPILADQIGLPWPIDGELTVIESYDPYLNGYAGWYDVRAEEIEIGDELDTHVMFHELSHVWFNGALFDERWITEGLADEFGAEVVEAIGEERPEPPSTNRSNSAAIALNRWSVLSDDVDQEEWAYGASWRVTRAMADIVGLDVLAAAARAASNDEIAYVGDGAPETLARDRDWRLYLDLIENRGQVEDDGIGELFDQWIVEPDQDDDLAERSVRRDRYAELDRAGEPWAPPLAVRRALSRWEFDDADGLMVDAEAVLDRRGQVAEVIDDLAPSLPEGSVVELPDDLEQAYEEAEDDLADATDLTERALVVAEDLLATGRSVDAATGPLQRIGAIGADHREELAVAAARFTGGDLDGAAAGADRIDADVDDLSGRGLLRVAGAIGGLIVPLLGLWLVRRRLASRGKASVPELPPGTTEGDAGDDDADDDDDADRDAEGGRSDDDQGPTDGQDSSLPVL